MKAREYPPGEATVIRPRGGAGDGRPAGPPRAVPPVQHLTLRPTSRWPPSLFLLSNSLPSLSLPSHAASPHLASLISLLRRTNQKQNKTRSKSFQYSLSISLILRIPRRRPERRECVGHWDYRLERRCRCWLLLLTPPPAFLRSSFSRGSSPSVRHRRRVSAGPTVRPIRLLILLLHLRVRLTDRCALSTSTGAGDRFLNRILSRRRVLCSCAGRLRGRWRRGRLMRTEGRGWGGPRHASEVG